MSSFATHRRRVLDESLPPRTRHTNLRSCLVRFAPYGFRATYHHLCLSARIPRRPEADPDSVVRAVEELHRARQLWLADERAYAARRRAEKALGRRQPPRDGSWRRWQRQWGNIAHCPDPAFHPTEPLPVVVERVLRSSVADADASTCRVCGQRDDTVVRADGSLWEHVLCARCGVGLARRRAPRDLRLEAERSSQWKEIWASRADHRRSGGPPHS
jgi:hypothetical protein